MPDSAPLQHLRLCLQSQISPEEGSSESVGPGTWDLGEPGLRSSEEALTALDSPLPFSLGEILSRRQFTDSEIHKKHIAQVPRHEQTEMLGLHLTDETSEWQQDNDCVPPSLPHPICATFRSSPPRMSEGRHFLATGCKWEDAMLANIP